MIFYFSQVVSSKDSSVGREMVRCVDELHPALLQPTCAPVKQMLWSHDLENRQNFQLFISLKKPS